MYHPITRRAALRGVGVSLALPWLESLDSRPARAATADLARPQRMAFLYVPNGMHMPDWTPKSEGPLGDLPPILAPLAPLKTEFSMLSGLALDGGRPHGDGPGDHARALASFLTAAHPVKTAGKDIRSGVSVDQVAAAEIGRQTRFPSLELGCDHGAQAGNCDSGYSCAYTTNIAWRTPQAPLAHEVSPRAAFDRLFGVPPSGRPDAARETRNRQSVLDFVAEDAADLGRQLTGNDRRKLDEYLSAVREVERRLALAEASPRLPAAAAAPPAGVPKNYVEHVRLMMDVMTLAFQTDSTRIITFTFANESSNRSYPDIGVTSGHHELSHHGGNAEKQAGISKINRHHVGLLAYFLEKLRAAEEGGATLLDRSMIVYGSGIGDGNRHNHDDLPILVAGRGGGLRPGRHLRYSFNTPLANLYVAMLRRMGLARRKFADSVEELEGLG